MREKCVRVGRTALRLMLHFAAAFTLLWLLRRLWPVCTTVGGWLDHAVTVSGAQIDLHLGQLTLALDRNILEMLGTKWDMLTAASASLVPPTVGEILHKIGQTMLNALRLAVM